MNEEEKRTKFFGFRWRWEEGDQVLKQIWIGWMDARECDGRRHEAMTGEHAASTARRARPSSCLSPSNLGYVPFRPLPCSNTSTYQVSLILPHPIWPGTLQPWAFTCPRPSSPHTRTPLLARTHVRQKQTRAGKGTREQVALVGGSIASHAARRGSPLQGPRVSHGSQQAAINEGHHPLSKPTAHSQTYRTGEPRARHHHPLSLSPAVLLAVIDESGSRVRYSLKVHPPTALRENPFIKAG